MLHKYSHIGVWLLDDHQTCVLALSIAEVGSHSKYIFIETLQRRLLRHKVSPPSSVEASLLVWVTIVSVLIKELHPQRSNLTSQGVVFLNLCLKSQIF